MESREFYMKEALSMARDAFSHEEVPVGCVIVSPEGSILARERNHCRERQDATAHAELLAIQQAEKALGSPHLEGCTLYVTLEPCPMCAGAIVQARMDRLVIGTMSPKAGCAGSILNLMDVPQFNHQVPVTKGVCGDECSRMLTEFFAELRKKK